MTALSGNAMALPETRLPQWVTTPRHLHSRVTGQLLATRYNHGIRSPVARINGLPDLHICAWRGPTCPISL
jgi:hypothetical protein